MHPKKSLPPIAEKRPHKITIHGQVLEDDYHWLRDKNWPKTSDRKILNYLKEENNYSSEFFSKYEKLQEQLYNEMKGRIKLSDISAAIKRRNYHYFHKTFAESEYKQHLRKNSNNIEEIVIDENIEAKGKEFFSLGTIAISPNDEYAAYSTDVSGNEYYTIKVRVISEQIDLEDEIKNTLGSIVWANDNSGFYYNLLDENWRPNKIFFHKLGTKQSNDKLIYHENDNTFRVAVSKSRDEKYIFVNSSSSEQDEVRIINQDNSTTPLIVRSNKHLFAIDHFKNRFFLLTNDKGKNFRLVSAENEHDLSQQNYKEILAHSNNIYLTDFFLFNEYLVINKREQGLNNIYIYDFDYSLKDKIIFPDAAYKSDIVNSWHDDNGVLISYSSLRTPPSVLKYKFDTKNLEIIKEQEIPSGHNQEDYAIERLYVDSREEGIEIPVSLIYKKSLFKDDNSNPLLLYGYGSYGYAYPPSFNSNVFSLIDRGFVFAIAHIRGGDDLGYNWYEQAKFLNKKRTFNDFIDILKFFAESNYSNSQNISIWGGSAGGMLVGVTLNEASKYLHSAIADVPFVDVLNTMLDETLPLTPGEFKEWGNPKEKEYFDYIKSYSPYDNIKSQNYPHVFVCAGLNDPRVTYWEPAKYVAKLRDKKTDHNLLIMETEMHAGHQGKTGRFSYLKELAKKYVFLLATRK